MTAVELLKQAFAIDREAREVALRELLAQVEVMQPDLSATAPEHEVGCRYGQNLMRDRIAGLIRFMLPED